MSKEIIHATQEWVQNELDEKINKEEGKGLSSNDFTDDYKTKIDSFGFNVEVTDNILILSENA